LHARHICYERRALRPIWYAVGRNFPTSGPMISQSRQFLLLSTIICAQSSFSQSFHSVRYCYISLIFSVIYFLSSMFYYLSLTVSIIIAQSFVCPFCYELQFKFLIQFINFSHSTGVNKLQSS
jgi:hypothetical protein